jgi:hypothetical protein
MSAVAMFFMLLSAKTDAFLVPAEQSVDGNAVKTEAGISRRRRISFLSGEAMFFTLFFAKTDLIDHFTFQISLCFPNPSTPNSQLLTKNS